MDNQQIMGLLDSNKSSYISPIYKIAKVPVWEVCNQKINPNTLNKTTFFSLIVSIFNNGITQTPCAYINDNLIKSDLTILDRINLCLNGDDESVRSGCFSGEFNFANSLSSEDRKIFKYHLVDGTQRTSLIRLGTYYYLTEFHSYADKWKEGRYIPKLPGKVMLSYIAWRENFCIPLSIIDKGDKTEEEMAALMILSNSSRGRHNFEVERKVINELSQTKDIDWIRRNLYMEEEHINRLTGKKKLKDMKSDSEIWVPEKTERYAQVEFMYRCNEALRMYNNMDINKVTEIIKNNGYESQNEMFNDINNPVEYFRRFGIDVNSINRSSEKRKLNWDCDYDKYTKLFSRRLRNDC